MSVRGSPQSFQAAGVAFPVASLERLGLMDEFIDLFDAQNRDVLVTSLKASPIPTAKPPT